MTILTLGLPSAAPSLVTLFTPPLAGGAVLAPLLGDPPSGLVELELSLRISPLVGGASDEETRFTGGLPPNVRVVRRLFKLSFIRFDLIGDCSAIINKPPIWY
ncbi:MAG: hypothetical protein MJE63_13745 [Proteobacteria bacterium]|nr:hypothetical protein [Pseudomonadota bacterium]